MSNKEIISETHPDLFVCDCLDDAIIGIAERINFGPVVAYSVEKIIDILMTRDGMTEVEATEFFYKNINNAWVGEKTPIYIFTDTL
jgi:hypothetical protein